MDIGKWEKTVVIAAVLMLMFAVVLVNLSNSTLPIVGVTIVLFAIFWGIFIRSLDNLIAFLLIYFVGFETELMSFSIGKLYLVDILVLFVLILLFRRVTRNNLKDVSIYIYLIFFMIIHSLIFGFDKIVALKAVLPWIRALIIMTYIYVSFNERRIKFFYYGLLSFTLLQLVIGSLQIANNGPIGLGILGESDTVFRSSVSGFERGMSGTFGHPAMLSYYSLFALGWSLFIPKGISSIVRTALIAFLSVTIVLTAARTALLIMVILFVFRWGYNIKYNGQKINTIIIALLTLASITTILLFAFPPTSGENLILDRFTKSDINQQVINRYEHIKYGIELIRQRPFMGWGTNNYLSAIQSIYSVDSENDPFIVFFLTNRIHNIFIMFLVDYGLFGGVAFIYILIIRHFRYFLRKIKLYNNTPYLGALCGLISYVIYGLQGQGGVTFRGIYILFINIAFMLYAEHTYKLNRLE